MHAGCCLCNPCLMVGVSCGEGNWSHRGCEISKTQTGSGSAPAWLSNFPMPLRTRKNWEKIGRREPSSSTVIPPIGPSHGKGRREAAPQAIIHGGDDLSPDCSDQSRLWHVGPFQCHAQLAEPAQEFKAHVARCDADHPRSGTRK